MWPRPAPGPSPFSPRPLQLPRHPSKQQQCSSRSRITRSRRVAACRAPATRRASRCWVSWKPGGAGPVGRRRDPRSSPGGGLEGACNPPHGYLGATRIAGRQGAGRWGAVPALAASRPPVRRESLTAPRLPRPRIAQVFCTAFPAVKSDECVQGACQKRGEELSQ